MAQACPPHSDKFFEVRVRRRTVVALGGFLLLEVPDQAFSCQIQSWRLSFVNSKGKPFRVLVEPIAQVTFQQFRHVLSDNVVKYGIHRARKRLIGIHCFRHGVTSELLEAGTPIHIVSRLMRFESHFGPLRPRDRRCRACRFREILPEDRAQPGSIGVRASIGVS
jgi:hypothetical protein